jgi:hypothetical protein
MRHWFMAFDHNWAFKDARLRAGAEGLPHSHTCHAVARAILKDGLAHRLVKPAQVNPKPYEKTSRSLAESATHEASSIRMAAGR